jgi:delta1-piperideine-2-carboxylate reductase
MDMNGDQRVHLQEHQLQTLLQRALVRHGLAGPAAAIIASNCAAAERDGARSHGVFRLDGYVATLASGWVNGEAVPQVQALGDAYLRVDAGNGFAQPALQACRKEAVVRARRAGACVIAIHNSHHFGALWPDVEPFAEQGLVALCVVNSASAVVPHGGKTAVFGTNPMAFAAPRANQPPLVFDQATSTMARGDVRIAAREGRQLPHGTGVDKHGVPTGDPAEILDGGALMTFAGHKGTTLSLMIEVMAAAITGGKFSFEVDSSDYPGAQTPHTGQLLILIDPARSGPLAAFTARIERLVEVLREAGMQRMPGEKRYAARALAAKEGIALTVADVEMLHRHAGG